MYLVSEDIYKIENNKYWCEYYLTDITLRFRYIYKNKGYHKFWMNFHEVFNKMKKHIIFKAKIKDINKECITLFTVWDTKNSYDEYKKTINNEYFKLIFKTNLFVKKINNVTLKKTIDNFKNNSNIIIQICSDEHMVKNLKIGDPFLEKKYSLYR